MDRIIIAGTNSGCGKTTVTLSLLSAFRNRGINLCSFKCGPDYIDPIFHRELMGIHTRNLDPFFTPGKALSDAIASCDDKELTIIEGVMGYYDGVGATTKASTYQLACETKTPVILVLRPQGMCTSAAAIMRGFKTYKRNSNIVGVIFSCVSEKMYSYLKPLAQSSGLRPLGYLPKRDDLMIPSRHLGLVSNFNKADIQRQLGLLGELAEKYIDLSAVLELATAAPSLPSLVKTAPPTANGPTIAVARDDAFCFIYEENLEALLAEGCQLVYFSPLEDSGLPDKVSGLYLPGGYPELYAPRLSANTSMLKAIKNAVSDGMPTIAECGGFMYLHRKLDDYTMVDFLPARAYKTDTLKRFGYITLKAGADSLISEKDDEIRCHEFHYWDSTDTGEAFTAEKAGSKTFYTCAYASDSLYAGFPHLYFPAAPNIAPRFVNKAAEYSRLKER